MAVYKPSGAGLKPNPLTSKPAAKKKSTPKKAVLPNLGGGLSQYKKKQSGAVTGAKLAGTKKATLPAALKPGNKTKVPGVTTHNPAKAAKKPSGKLAAGAAAAAKTAITKKTATKSSAASGPNYSSGVSSSGSGSGGGGASGGGASRGGASRGGSTSTTSGGGGSTEPTKTLEQQAREAVEKMYKSSFDELGRRGDDITANDATMNATAAAFKAWRDSRTDAATNAISKANTDASAAVAQNLAAMGTAMAESQARLTGLAGGQDVQRASSSGMADAVSAALATLAQNDSRYAENAAAASSTQANKQRGVDVANQQALVTDFAGITAAARKALSSDKANLELQKEQAVQKYISDAKQAEMDQQLQNYAMGKDAAKMDLEYAKLTNQRDIVNANNATKLKITQAQLASQQKIAAARLGVAQKKNETDKWYQQQQINLKKTGLSVKSAKTLLDAAKSSKAGTLKSWEAQVKKQGKAFDQVTADKSLISGIQNSMAEVIAASGRTATKQQILMAITGAWGIENVNKVRGSLGL